MRVCFAMMVGLSGSGKSTYAKYLIEEVHENKNCAYLSSDALRGELLGDENSQSNNELVFKTMMRRTVENLRKGVHVFYDATNLNARQRTNLLKALKNQVSDEVQFECIVMATPYQICIAQDAKCDRTVGERVIIKQMKQFQVPFYNEGWDKIHIIGIQGEYVPTQDLIEQMAKTDEHTRYHTDNILDHSFDVIDGLPDDSSTLLYAAALMHDVGKPLTKQTDDDGFDHFYCHNNVGAYLFITSDYNDIISKNELKYPFSNAFLQIAFYINWHMQPFNVNNFRIWAESRNWDEQCITDVMTLHESDVAAAKKSNSHII